MSAIKFGLLFHIESDIRLSYQPAFYSREMNSSISHIRFSIVLLIVERRASSI